METVTQVDALEACEISCHEDTSKDENGNFKEIPVVEKEDNKWRGIWKISKLLGRKHKHKQKSIQQCERDLWKGPLSEWYHIIKCWWAQKKEQCAYRIRTNKGITAAKKTLK